MQIDVIAARNSRVRNSFELSNELRVELIRKSIHLLIALVPGLSALIGTSLTLTTLALGIFTYSYAEMQRNMGKRVFLITNITVLAARKQDQTKFILGPVTLAIGAMLALLVYPAPAAIIAIYALAFGDGISSIFGKFFGKTRLPFTDGKTLEGSLACFTAVFLVSIQILGNVEHALIIAVSASILEAIPLKDLDNIVIPVGVGFIASGLIII